MTDVKEIGLEPGYFFSPGIYRNFWIRRIESVFPEDIINKNVRLKQYREMWVGSAIAAGYTKKTGKKHFVGVAKTDPPDVVIASFHEEEQRSGKIGIRAESVKVEITRCSLEDGEDLATQILKKNTAAYQDMVLCVCIFGDDQDFNLDDATRKLHEAIKIYPSEIHIVARVGEIAGEKVPSGTFVQSFLYPEVSTTVFNLFDDNAYFSDPQIVRLAQRGVSNKLEPIGNFRIRIPEI